MRTAGQALYKDIRGARSFWRAGARSFWCRRGRAQGAGLSPGLPAEKKAHYEKSLVGPPPRHATSCNYIRPPKVSGSSIGGRLKFLEAVGIRNLKPLKKAYVNGCKLGSLYVTWFVLREEYCARVVCNTREDNIHPDLALPDELCWSALNVEATDTTLAPGEGISSDHTFRLGR